MTRPKWLAIGILIAVFVLGGVAGAGGMAAWHGKERRDVAKMGFGPRGERPLIAMMHRLDLSREQRVRIEQLLVTHAPRRRELMQRMMAECGSDLAQEKAALDKEIRSVLDERQKKMFDELSERQRERLFGPPRPRPERF